MLAYIIRRLLYAIPILIGVNLLTFALFFVVNTPDDMARMQLGVKRVTPEAIQKWKAERGYDKPLVWNSAAAGGARLTDTIFFSKSVRMFAVDFGRADDGRDIAREISNAHGAEPGDRRADLRPRPFRGDIVRPAAGVLPRHDAGFRRRRAVRGDDVDLGPVLHHRRPVAGVQGLASGADLGLQRRPRCGEVPRSCR